MGRPVVKTTGRLIVAIPATEDSPEYKQALTIAFRARLMEEYKLLEKFLELQRQEKLKSVRKNPGGVFE